MKPIGKLTIIKSRVKCNMNPENQLHSPKGAIEQNRSIFPASSHTKLEPNNDFVLVHVIERLFPMQELICMCTSNSAIEIERRRYGHYAIDY